MSSVAQAGPFPSRVLHFTLASHPPRGIIRCCCLQRPVIWGTESLKDLSTVTRLESSKDRNSNQNVWSGSNHPCLFPPSTSWRFFPVRPLTNFIMIHDSSVPKGRTDSPLCEALRGNWCYRKKAPGQSTELPRALAFKMRAMHPL